LKRFAQLLELLALTPSRNRKIEALRDYFRATPDPDRGFALAILTGRADVQEREAGDPARRGEREVDPYLFRLSYDYVGDLGETIALIWPHHQSEGDELPSLSDLVELFNTTSKAELPDVIAALLTRAEINERWALVKLATGALRIGLSARLAKTALAEMSGKPLQEIEEVWHGITLPYTELFAWLDGTAGRPDIDHAARFHPLMLSNPIDEEKDIEKLDAADFSAEWKWDGIRVQIIASKGRVSMFSRTGDDIAAAFPMWSRTSSATRCSMASCWSGTSFSRRRSTTCSSGSIARWRIPKLVEQLPAFVRVYDMLFDGSEDIRALPWTERRQRLEAWFAAHPQTRLDLSEVLPFASWEELAELRRGAPRSTGTKA
jgi:DNA ligase-1